MTQEYTDADISRIIECDSDDPEFVALLKAAESDEGLSERVRDVVVNANPFRVNGREFTVKEPKYNDGKKIVRILSRHKALLAGGQLHMMPDDDLDRLESLMFPYIEFDHYAVNRAGESVLSARFKVSDKEHMATGGNPALSLEILVRAISVFNGFLAGKN